MNKKEILAEMLRNAGISALNKMQESMIKTYGGGGNVVLLSPTGSGKTLAYLLPLFMELDGVWYSMPASDFGSFAMTWPFLLWYIRKFKRS